MRTVYNVEIPMILRIIGIFSFYMARRLVGRHLPDGSAAPACSEVFLPFLGH